MPDSTVTPVFPTPRSTTPLASTTAFALPRPPPLPTLVAEQVLAKGALAQAAEQVLGQGCLHRCSPRVLAHLAQVPTQGTEQVLGQARTDELYVLPPTSVPASSSAIRPSSKVTLRAKNACCNSMFHMF